MATHNTVAAAALAAALCLVSGEARAQTLFGSDCAGASGQAPSIGINGAPIAGQQFTVDIAGVPGSLGILLVGASNTDFLGFGLPLAADGPPLNLKTPGCFLNVSADLLISFITDGSGLTSFPATINNAGLTVFLQAFVVDFAPGDLGGFTRGVQIDSLPAGNPDGLGDIVVTEFMKNPAAVSDADGEWFEVFNTTTQDIDIEGWTLSGPVNNLHVVTNGGAGVIIPAQSFRVLARNGNNAQNGGLPAASVAYVYSNFFLGNGDDMIIITDDQGQLQDQVDYFDATFPQPDNGFAAGLNPALPINQTVNNDGANYCNQTSTYGAGDSGTPGAPNDTCP